MTTNPYETAARATKVLALVEALDHVFRAMKTPIDSVLAVEAISNLTPEKWETAAKLAQVNSPSEQTKAEIIDIYKRRMETRVHFEKYEAEQRQRKATVASGGSREVAEYEAEVYKQKRDARVAKKMRRGLR